MTIRLAKLPLETRSLNRLFNEHWHEDEGLIGFSMPIIPALAKNPIVLCAEKQNEIVGALVAYQPYLQADDLLTLCRMVVHRKHRGQHLPEELLIDFTQHLDDTNQGCFLTVEKSRTGLIKLYQDFGFQIPSDQSSKPRNKDYTYMERPSILD